MSGSAAANEPRGGVDLALAHCARLLAHEPALARAQAQEILKVAPGLAEARLLGAIALRLTGDPRGARDELRALCTNTTGWAAAWAQLGLAEAALGRGTQAIEALTRATRADPELGEAWLALADALTAAGDTQGADRAYGHHIRVSTRDPALIEAAQALCENDLPVAERLLREQLKASPTDVAAIRMLAEVAGRLGRYGDAETLLVRCLELAPGFSAARHNYALVLHRQEKSLEAIQQIDLLLEAEPRNPGYLNLKAAALARMGDFAGALPIYADVLSTFPDQPKIWMSYGHALKTAGRTDDGVDAYRRTIALEPNCGEAYWSLANLKTFRFTEPDLAAMRGQLAHDDLTVEDRFHLHYGLGKALEDAGDWEGSFTHYEQGARLRRGQIDYEPRETTRRVERARAVFTPEFFADREGWGCQAHDPVFVVGLPRSGSTLIEQILSSHSQVEGTMELLEIITMARELAGADRRGARSLYPEKVAELSSDEVRALGERFIDRTRIQRKTGKPFFIDKMPNNFLHIGLICLILPNARIIDARRHPLGACFSGFKQHFARGQHFSYDLEEIGRYYRDYVELMTHFDRVLPGRVHRIIYERMVEDTEAVTRRLLDHCGFAFEEACLRFWETQRPVRTASSEQVRRPIFREGLDHWRYYEPWLEPLKRGLGPALQTWDADQI